MPGPPAKHHSVRSRSSKNRPASTRRTLQANTDKLGELMDLSVPELKDRLREQRLPVGGRKADLARRLAYKDLPSIPGSWHPMVQQFWDDIWRSPMSPEWDESDVHNAYLLAYAYQDFWTASGPTGRQMAMSEIRLQRRALGLDPASRRSLEWTIEQADEAKARGRKRRAAEKPPPAKPDPDKSKDPRERFRVMQGGA